MSCDYYFTRLVRAPLNKIICVRLIYVCIYFNYLKDNLFCLYNWLVYMPRNRREMCVLLAHFIKDKCKILKTMIFLKCNGFLSSQLEQLWTRVFIFRCIPASRSLLTHRAVGSEDRRISSLRNKMHFFISSRIRRFALCARVRVEGRCIIVT